MRGTPMGQKRRASCRARARRRDDYPAVRHEAGENGGEGRRSGEAAFDDEVAGRVEAVKQMGGHQARIEGRERRARLRGRGRLALDPPLAPGERAALVAKRRQGQGARRDDGGDVRLPASAGLSPASAANSRPPMKRAVGTGAPRTSTLASMSAFGSSRPFPPTAMMMTQVPVEITVNGSRLVTRWGTREALESCAPQTTLTFGASPVAAATSGRAFPACPRPCGAVERAAASRTSPPCSTAGPRSDAKDPCASRPK